MFVAFSMSGPEVVVAALVVVLTIIPIWALVDAVRRPEWQWEGAGSSKGLWIVLLVVGIFLCDLAVLVAVFYFIAVQPKLKSIERLGPNPGFPGRGGNFP